ncbi:MAG TPA: hypothetical protein VHE34_21255 [Puia sp.]|uniref:hypothetical protein n=1 Tax=Puia sp. TaxID=2045100 RepID=UPI002BF10201|nr:hypothetical protein [Puia sp.]HVU97772.1 hypothetical protein [Puia sp.]
MLPEFSRVREQLDTQQREFFTSAVRMYSGVFRDAGYSVMHEGNGLVSYYDDLVHTSPMKKMTASFTLDIAEIKNNPLLIYEHLLAMAKEMADQQVSMSVQTISEVTELVGNKHVSKGTVTPEDIFAIYEKVEISFQPNGQPNMPSIVAGELMGAQINAALLQIKENAAYTQRFQEILETKRMQWYDRENNRKLVD